MKRREDRPDHRYGSNQVVAVYQEQPDAGNSQRQKSSGPAWGQNRKCGVEKLRLTYEAMLDGPCSYHTHDPRRPANHSTRQCSWYQRTRMEAGGNQMGTPQRPPAPRSVPLTGANTILVNAPPPRPAASRPVNQVDVGGSNGNAGPGRRVRYCQDEYREAHQGYVVFITEPTDKQSLHRCTMEVNAVMPAVTKYMNWADQKISWSIDDHPRIMPSPGCYALVVDPTFIGPALNVRFTRVLVDNGSNINIMY